MRRWPLTVLLAAMGPLQAHASAFQAKTSRFPLSNREVERSLVMEKGWLEFALGADVKNATGYWDADGNPVDFQDATWLYTTESLELRYGLASHVELYWNLPVHYLRLTNDRLGTDISDFGIGDPHVGLRASLLRKRAPLSSLALRLDYKGPAGKESPSVYLGAPNAVDGFIMSTGTPDFTVALGFKQQLGPAAVLAEAGYTMRFCAVAQYIVETELNQLGGRIKPGDVAFADLGLMGQLGPLALQAGALYQNRAETRIGAGGDDFFGVSLLEPVQGSDGWSLDGQFSATANVTRGIDLVAGVDVPLRGEDLQFFPLEDIHPTRGNTYSFIFKFRY